MADQKITQLTELTTPTGVDLLAIVDDPSGSPTTKKVTLQNLIDTGWTGDSDTWVYVSATSFKIESKDVTDRFTTGTRVRYKQGGSYEYGVVAANSTFSTDTTVVLVANDDYALANASITDNYYSYQINPQGYPTWFSFTPSWTGSGGMTYASVTNHVAKFSIVGKLFFFEISATGTTGTAASVEIRITTMPVAPQQTAFRIGGGCVITDTTTMTGYWTYNTIFGIAHYDTANWGQGASRSVRLDGFYQIA